MRTPICDFVKEYARRDVSRLHMPGHKGQPFLGCEALDITEVAGADSLYEAEGIIAQSEANAAALFGAGCTVYSTEGSSQCIRAMLCLAAQAAGGEKPLIMAARNAHKTFVLAAALLDLQVQWLWPETAARSLCSCPVSPAALAAALAGCEKKPAAVYLTSPDYLGGVQDVAALSAVCHRAGVPLLVDNAHGAYLHFLPTPAHPLDLGADLCCDSAHKTLPVLTGGAYLQVSKNAPAAFAQNAKQAMALFGSTSPSYLILQSLDLANRYLADGYGAKLAACAKNCARLKEALVQAGWQLWGEEPIKLTVDAAASGQDGSLLADRLRRRGVECEYADRDFLVLMVTPQNREMDYARVAEGLGRNTAVSAQVPALLSPLRPRQAVSIRQAVLANHETVPLAVALGRVLASPTVACPPAVPVLVSGEVIDEAALAAFAANGIRRVDVVAGL